MFLLYSPMRPESSSFARVRVNSLICVFLCGFTTASILWRWWNKAKLLMRGWIWRVFIVIAKTRSSASRIMLPSHLLDVRAAREQIHMGGVTYPTLPTARGSTPAPVRLWPAPLRLLAGRLLHWIPASSAPQCLLQRDDWTAASLLQPGETEQGLTSR